MANRIHPDFTNDIRRPLTTHFLMMLFFGSFAIAPWTLRQFSEQSDTISAWITNSTASLQEKFQSQITDSMTKTFQENLEETWNTYWNLLWQSAKEIQLVKKKFEIMRQ